MGKSVCFLVTEHPFLDARIFKKEAKSLVKQGYQVTMIVPRKKGHLFDVDGKIFLDDFLSKTFIHEGIKVVTYEQMNPEKNIKQLHHHLQSERHDRFNDPLTKLGIDQQSDIYHAHEFFSLYSGIGIKRALTSKGKNIKLIYDSHELEPDPLSYESDVIKKIKKQMLVMMLKELDYVITVSNSIKSWYLSLDPELPAEVIYNSPPLVPNYEPKQNRNSELLLAYEGSINKRRGSFHKLMKIVELCNQHFELKVKIIGGEKHSAKASSLHVPPHLKDKVIFTGWVDYDKIPEAMKDVDLGWVDLDAKHALNNRFAMPNKFFSYLNNGVPVLVNQCKDMFDFIQTYQCGYTVRKLQATAEDYVQALLYLYTSKSRIRKMSRNARTIMAAKYSWEHMEKKLFTVYSKLTEEM
jgi:glycosyltransferase involved in cell wall biosynthesis